MSAHGTLSRYASCTAGDGGGKCDACREANTIYRRNRRPLTMDGRRVFPFDPADWMEVADCRGLDPELFHPDRGEATGHIKALCAGCPVHAQCLQYAMSHGEKIGIWGGKSERERRVIRRSPFKRALVALAAEIEAAEMAS